VASLVKLYDCFLYTDQSPYAELLSLRLAYLGDAVDGFVVVIVGDGQARGRAVSQKREASLARASPQGVSRGVEPHGPCGPIPQQ